MQKIGTNGDGKSAVTTPDVEPLFFRGSGISASDADFTII